MRSEHHGDHDAEQDGHRPDVAASDSGQLLEEVAAHRKGGSTDEHHEDDDGERERASPARGVHVVRQFALANAEDDSSSERERERSEVCDEGCGERTEHDVRHDGYLQRDDGCHQDGGEAGECRAKGPVERGDHVGGEADRRRRALVLGDCRGGHAEVCEAVEEPQRTGEDHSDDEQDDAVPRHDHLAHADEAVRQRDRNLTHLAAVANRGQGLHHDEHTERGNDASEW